METSTSGSELKRVSDEKENSNPQNIIEKSNTNRKKVVGKRKFAYNHPILNQKRMKAVLDKQVSFPIS